MCSLYLLTTEVRLGIVVLLCFQIMYYFIFNYSLYFVNVPGLGGRALKEGKMF